MTEQGEAALPKWLNPKSTSPAHNRFEPWHGSNYNMWSNFQIQRNS